MLIIKTSYLLIRSFLNWICASHSNDKVWRDLKEKNHITVVVVGTVVVVVAVVVGVVVVVVVVVPDLVCIWRLFIVLRY